MRRIAICLALREIRKDTNPTSPIKVIIKLEQARPIDRSRNETQASRQLGQILDQFS